MQIDRPEGMYGDRFELYKYFKMYSMKYKLKKVYRG